MLKRKIDLFLKEWKENINHKPLIIYGARQVGKTTSIEEFAKSYESFIEINFVSEPKYISVFYDENNNKDFNVDRIIKRISRINNESKFIPHNTLILFDEIQEFMDATTSLKFFSIDGKYDVIMSGSALGINTKSISSVSVGYKDEYIMRHIDFEEFLLAKGYSSDFTNDILDSMINFKKLDEVTMNILKENFNDYVITGGYPEVVNEYIQNKNFSGIYKIQKRIYNDYMDDFTKYLDAIDSIKAKRVYDSISSQLAKDNHKFQFTKLGHGARFSSYFGISNYLKDVGIALISNNVNLDLPLKGNEDIDNFRMYFSDISLLISSIDEESQKAIRIDENMSIYKGAVYENILAIFLNDQGYENLYFYRSVDSTIELDFIIRYKDFIIPLECKNKNGRAISLNTILNKNIKHLKYGIKFSLSNINFSNNIINFPIYTAFLLKDFLDKVDLKNISNKE